MTRNTLIIAAMLLASTSAYAAKAKPQDVSDIRKWQDLEWQCLYSNDPPTTTTTTKICQEARRVPLLVSAQPPKN